MGRIKVAIAGVGNCASALVQGIYYYRNGGNLPGLMHEDFGGYKVADIEFVAAFDVNRDKIGRDLAEAIFMEPNCCVKFADVPKLGVEVLPAPVLDGVAPHMKEPFKVYDDDVDPVDVAEVLADVGADMLLNFVPVGSYNATLSLIHI